MKSTHNVKAYRNNTDTAAKAPFFGSYISRENVPVDALCTQVSALSGLTAIQVRAILEGSFDAIAELEKEGLVIVHLDGMSVCAVITGSFPTADAAFNPEKNALNLAIRLDDSIRLALADATAQLVTDADLTKVRLDNIKDLEVDRPTDLIHGRHPFRVAGVNLVLDDEGACVYLKGRNGVRHTVVVDTVATKQLFTAHTEELLDGGDYTLWVESRGGDAEGPLQRDSCRVKYLRVVDPVPAPTLTYCHSEEHTEEGDTNVVYEGYGLEFVGTNLTGATATATFQAGPEEDPTTLTVPANKLDIASQGMNAVIDAGWLADEILSSIDGGTAITFAFTTDGGTATLTAHKAE